MIAVQHRQSESSMTENRLLAVFAHPDDETFRPGGTLALLARYGVQVQVLTATRGQAGSRGHPPLCSPEDLPVVRERELRCACTALGILPPILLDYQDGHLTEVDPNEVIEQIIRVAETVRPQVLLTFGPDGLSGHPDHILIGQLVKNVFDRMTQVVALYTVAVPQSLVVRLGMPQIRAVPDESITLTVDVSAAWDAKLAAVRCHRTQLGESPILQAPEEKQRLFLGKEYFRRAQGRSCTDFFLEIFSSIEGNTE
jgi:N-acetylglucosamine malate deacetylase 2